MATQAKTYRCGNCGAAPVRLDSGPDGYDRCSECDAKWPWVAVEQKDEEEAA